MRTENPLLTADVIKVALAEYKEEHPDGKLYINALGNVVDPKNAIESNQQEIDGLEVYAKEIGYTRTWSSPEEARYIYDCKVMEKFDRKAKIDD